MKEKVKKIGSRRDEVEKLKYKRKWYRMRRFHGEEIGNYIKTIVLISRKSRVLNIAIRKGE
jgi:phosphatidylserine decarboxylase